MKKIVLTVICFLAITSFASGEVIFYNMNQATLAWDAVTVDIDGDSITDVKYRIYIANAVTDPGKTNPVIVANDLTVITTTITLGIKGKFFVGVSAFIDDLESDINWADIPTSQGTNPLFGLRFAVPPKPPHNIVR